MSLPTQRYPNYEHDDDATAHQAIYNAASESTNYWPAERYLPDAVEAASAHLGGGLAWFGFWLAVGMACLAFAPLLKGLSP